MTSIRLHPVITMVLFLVTACADGGGATRVLPTEPSLAKPAPAPPPIATAVDLGLGAGSEAMAVNDLGQIVGTAPGLGAFIWENGSARSLGTLPGMTSSSAYDINESGQVVGYSHVGSEYHAFTWTAAGGMQPLAGPPSGCCTMALGINDDGVIVGQATLAGGDERRMVVWENGVMRDIQGPHPGSVFPGGINNSRLIVGSLQSGSGGAFSWTEGTGIVQLPDLGGRSSEALDVNSNGEIVGWAPIPGATSPTAFLWQNGVITRLGTLGGSSSVGTGINDAGEIVGRSDVASKRKGLLPQPRAFLWTPALGMRDLGTPGSRSGAWAHDLNSTGWIVGVSWASSGDSYATLWRRP